MLDGAHTVSDAIYRNMPWTLDHALDTCCSRLLDQFTKRDRLLKHRIVVGVSDASRAHAIAETDRNIVLACDLEQVIKLRIERVLSLVGKHPCDGERASAAHHIQYPAACCEMFEYLPVYACMNRHEVNTAFCMFPNRVKEIVSGHLAFSPAGCMIDRNRADRDANYIKNLSEHLM